MISTFSPIITDFSSWQLVKARSPIWVIWSCISIVVIPLWAKVYGFISVMVAGNLISVREEHPAKAPSPMICMLQLGSNIISLIYVLPLNAFSAIFDTKYIVSLYEISAGI